MNFERIKLFIPLIVFAVLAALFFVLEKRIDSGEYDPSALPSAMIGNQLPVFELSLLSAAETFVTSHGLLEKLNGKAALINVWATWCVSCRTEHAYLNQLAQSGIVIFGLNYKDDRTDAKRWLQRLGNPYVLNLFDKEGKLGLDLGVYGAPETYVLDSQGVVRYRHVGVINDKVWQRKILPLGLPW